MVFNSTSYGLSFQPANFYFLQGRSRGARFPNPTMDSNPIWVVCKKLGSPVPTDEFLNGYQRRPASCGLPMSCGFTSRDNTQI